MSKKSWLFVLTVGFSLIFIGILRPTKGASHLPKNIIFYIGDGMGLSCVTAAKIVAGEIAMEKLPYTALVITFSEKDNIITDSAAAATALATGHKTQNGFIATHVDLGSNGSARIDTLKTVLEWAEEQGMATGLVATSSITHATPASFAAHVHSRSLEDEIARQLAHQEIEVLFGGGRRFFLKHGGSKGEAQSQPDLLAMFRAKGYRVLESYEEFQAFKPEESDRVIGLFSEVGMPDIPARKPTLPEMTAKALAILKKDRDGFFLMVEGSQIDWKAHANNVNGLIAETLEFDQAVAVGMDFAKKNGQTLIVVTADHETGGAAILNREGNGNGLNIAFSTNHHTAVMVPVLASGPGAEVFHGIIDNTFIGNKLIEYVTHRP